MIDPLVTIDPNILSGEPVFAGTRVPVKTLTDYLIGGDTVETFLTDFPSVSRQQVVRFLRDGQALIVGHATGAKR